MSKLFTWRLHSGAQNQRWCFICSVITHTSISMSFILHAKWMVKKNSSILLLIFLNDLRRHPLWWRFLLRYMCGVMVVKKGCNDNSWCLNFTIFFFLSYCFIEFFLAFFIFSFQKTYNDWLKEKWEDDLLTHLNFNSDMWFKAGSLVDLIEIKYMDSLTLKPRICERPVVFHALKPLSNWFCSRKLWSFRQL